MQQLMQVDKIIWAVDPFAEQVMLQRASAWALNELTQAYPSSVIQPVFLANDFSAEGRIPQRLIRSYVEKVQTFANDSLSKITHRIPLKNVRPLQVISRPFESVKQGVQELIRNAAHQGGHLIVAGTRAGKGGSSPLGFAGSFVESLLEHSDIPVLAVNPHWKHGAGIPSLLFPSDLSPDSHKWFVETLELAKTIQAKVILFHRISLPLSQPLDTAIRIFPEIRDTLQKKIKASHGEAKRWAQDAKRAGVKLSQVIDSQLSGSVLDALLKCLEQHPSSVMIMPPLSETYPRSTIQSLMKRSPFPMLYVPTAREKVSHFEIRKKAA
jgi:nucleotide-binding universal stress UspA family protein